MSVRPTILKSVLIFFALIWLADAEAAIYKWKDENGKTHFTDDSTKVPQEFQDKPFIKGRQPQRETPKPKEEKAQGEGGETSAEKKPGENEKKEDDKKKEGITEAQRSALEAAVSFLKADIPRYEKFYTYPPSRSKFRVLKQAVAGATAQKQGLFGQVKQHDLPELKAVAGFLDASIAADEKSQKIMPTTITSTRQTQALVSRLKGETETEKKLLEQLTAALSAKK
jgi:hypothetical protein